MSGRNGFCVLSRNLSPNAPLSAAHFRMRKIINDVRVACSAGGPLSYRSAIWVYMKYPNKNHRRIDHLCPPTRSCKRKGNLLWNTLYGSWCGEKRSFYTENDLWVATSGLQMNFCNLPKLSRDLFLGHEGPLYSAQPKTVLEQLAFQKGMRIYSGDTVPSAFSGVGSNARHVIPPLSKSK